MMVRRQSIGKISLFKKKQQVGGNIDDQQVAAIADHTIKELV
jgi:hypothetical protein